MKLKKVLSVVLSATLLLGSVGLTASAQTASNGRYNSFQNPSIDYKSRPLWFWNAGSSAELDNQKLHDIIAGSVESGYSGFGILPYTFSDYMSDEYLEKYRVVLEECKKAGLKINLYDENGFPSGAARPLFAQQFPDDRAKYLSKTEKDITGPAKGTLNVTPGTEKEPLMGVVAMNMDTKEIIDLSDDVVIGEEVSNIPFTTSASSYFTVLPGYTADMATDGNMATRWNAGDQSGNDEWLQIEFEEPQQFNGVSIYEALDRTTSYHVEYWDDEAQNWVTLSSGSTIGSSKTDSFEAVTAQKVRLYIDTIVDPDINSVSIYEFDVLMDGMSILRTGGDYVPYDLPEGNWKLMSFNVLTNTNDTSDFCDYLDPDAVKNFISITHDRYYEAFPEYFGDVIDMTFYDEPAMWRNDTWTGKFNEKFEAKYGYNPITLYPALWYDIGEDTASARNKLFSFRADLFADGWTKTLADWCDEHGIDLTGHVGEEELVNPTSTVGDLMKVFRDQDIPGIDSVIFYGRISRALKVVSSAANNYDKAKVMTEIHGASDHLDVPTLYRDTMDHYAKGINLMVPHAVWYNAYGSGFMNPNLTYDDPTWGPVLPEYNEYVGRTSSILQEGRHVADIGVVYPIASLQTDYSFDIDYDRYKGGITPKAEWNYMDIGEMLSLDIRRDFTYLHPDVIDDRCEVIGDTFQMNNDVNWENYKVIILPGMDTISLSNLQKIKEFYDNGGLVIGTRQLPYLSVEEGKNEEVCAIIEEMFGVDPRTSTGPIYTSSSQYEVAWDGDMIGLEPWKAGDDSAKTRWESSGSSDEWLCVDLQGDKTISKAVIQENGNNVTSYVLQYWDATAEEWVDITSGEKLGAETTLEFTPVTTSKIRLSIPTASSRIGINEFTLYGENGENLIFPDSIETDNAAGGKSVYLPNASAKNLEAALDSTGLTYDFTVENSTDLKVSGGNLSYIHKVVDDSDYYFVANSSDNNLDTIVTLRGTLEHPAIWDPHTGERYAAEYTYDTVNGEPVTKVRMRMAAVESLFIVDDEAAEEMLYTRALEKAVESANNIAETMLTSVSQEILSYYTAQAEALLADPAATQEAIDSMTDVMTQMLDSLEYKNLAYLKPAEASHSITANGFGLDKATDGDTATMFSTDVSSEDHTEWFLVDLGEVKSIDQVNIVPRGDDPYQGLFYPNDYVIQVSTDKETWETVASVTDAPLPTDTTPVEHHFDAVDARYVRIYATSLRAHPGIDANYRLQFSEFEVYGPETDISLPDPVVTLPDSDEPITSALKDQTFKVTVTTRADAAQIGLFNENDMKMGLRNVNYVVNLDGTKTWTFEASIGTVGDGRTLKLYTHKAGEPWENLNQSITLDIKASKPQLTSVQMDETGKVNQPVTLTVVADMDTTRIHVYNENGLKMGVTSSFEDTEEGRVFTISMKIGTPGTRHFTVNAVNKYGVESDPMITNDIVITWF